MRNIVYARWYYRKCHSSKMVHLDGQAVKGTAESLNATRERWDKHGQGRICWEWEEVLPGDADYPSPQRQLEEEAARRGPFEIYRDGQQFEIVTTENGRFAIVHSLGCDKLVPVAERRKS